MSDEREQGGGDETTELSTAPQTGGGDDPEPPAAPSPWSWDAIRQDPYLVVMLSIAGVLLVLLLAYVGVLAGGGNHCARPLTVAPVSDVASASPAVGSKPAAPSPEPLPPPTRVRPLEDDAASVSLPTPEDEMPYAVPVAAKCSWTRVADVGSRFADEPLLPDGSNGISVSFSNGLGLISYSSNPAIAATKIGSRVQVCLVQEMRGCPPRDDRGKTYRVYDPIQGIAWTMGADLHVCGGA